MEVMVKQGNFQTAMLTIENLVGVFKQYVVSQKARFKAATQVVDAFLATSRQWHCCRHCIRSMKPTHRILWSTEVSMLSFRRSSYICGKSLERTFKPQKKWSTKSEGLSFFFLSTVCIHIMTSFFECRVTHPASGWK